MAQISQASLTEPRVGEADWRLSGSTQASLYPLPRSSPEEDQARTTGSNPLVWCPFGEYPSEVSSNSAFDRQDTTVRRVNSLQVPPTGHAPDHEALRKTTSAPATQVLTAAARHDTVSLEAQDNDEIVS